MPKQRVELSEMFFPASVFLLTLTSFLCQVIQLPRNSITLYGNQSTDDHDSLSYEWSLSPESKGKVVEMQVSVCRTKAQPSFFFLDYSSESVFRVCCPGGQDSYSAAVGHAGGGLHLPADGDGLVGTAGHFARDRHRAAR